MAQLVALYIEKNKLHSFDGTTHSEVSIPLSLFNVTQTYSAAHAWATTTAASLLSAHSNIVIRSDNFDDSVVNEAVASFKGFHEVSSTNFIKMLQGAINAYVANNSGTIKAFKLNAGNMRYFCPVCNAVHLGISFENGGSPNEATVEFVEQNHDGIMGNVVTHRTSASKAVPYSMHKHLIEGY